jgi:hypothetical protein
VIVEALFGLAMGIVNAVFGIIPSDPVASVVFKVDDIVTPLIDGLSSLGAWVPWQAVVICTPVVLSFYLGSFLLRVLRAVVGHIPFIGGNG